MICLFSNIDLIQRTQETGEKYNCLSEPNAST